MKSRRKLRGPSQQTRFCPTDITNFHDRGFYNFPKIGVQYASEPSLTFSAELGSSDCFSSFLQLAISLQNRLRFYVEYTDEECLRLLAENEFLTSGAFVVVETPSTSGQTRGANEITYIKLSRPFEPKILGYQLRDIRKNTRHLIGSR